MPEGYYRGLGLWGFRVEGFRGLGVKGFRSLGFLREELGLVKVLGLLVFAGFTAGVQLSSPLKGSSRRRMGLVKPSATMR